MPRLTQTGPDVDGAVSIQAGHTGGDCTVEQFEVRCGKIAERLLSLSRSDRARTALARRFEGRDFHAD